MPEPLVRLSQATWWFRRGVVVLDRIDLDVVPAQVVAVTGPNGCGKTTLLRLVAGALTPRAGSIVRPRRIGYVPQTGDDPPARVRATTWLESLARIKGTEAFDASFADALQVTKHLAKPMTDLSTGTVTKVLLLAAFAGAPSLLVLDEPFAPLDAASRDVLARTIRDVTAAGACVLISGHDGLPEGIADREIALS